MALGMWGGGGESVGSRQSTRRLPISKRLRTPDVNLSAQLKILG